jgi:hypothetical protein
LHFINHKRKERGNMSVDLADFDSEYTFANYPLKDKDSFVRAKLVEVKPDRIKDIKQRTSKTLQDDKTFIVTRFNFLLEGASKPIKNSVITGTSLNPNKVHVKAKGRGATKEQPEYNAFTEICLRLGFISLEQLNSRPEDISEILKKAFKSVSEENPIFIKAQLINIDSETSTLETVNIKTVEQIKPFEFNK